MPEVPGSAHNKQIVSQRKRCLDLRYGAPRLYYGPIFER